MADNERDASAGGDPLHDVLLGVASTIDQLAALIGGSAHPGAAGIDTGPFADLVGDLGTLLSELGDLLARILTALIAILEAAADALRSTPTHTPPASTFQSIPVRITETEH